MHHAMDTIWRGIVFVFRVGIAIPVALLAVIEAPFGVLIFILTRVFAGVVAVTAILAVGVGAPFLVGMWATPDAWLGPGLGLLVGSLGTFCALVVTGHELDWWDARGILAQKERSHPGRTYTVNLER